MYAIAQYSEPTQSNPHPRALSLILKSLFHLRIKLQRYLPLRFPAIVLHTFLFSLIRIGTFYCLL
jgi:hypothetical protein